MLTHYKLLYVQVGTPISIDIAFFLHDRLLCIVVEVDVIVKFPKCQNPGARRAVRGRKNLILTAFWQEYFVLYPIQ